ncbi:MAG: NADH-quinone oxidoreductase subunit NuoK [Cycloclasticus sp.]|nr:MAG: NADH-quinone oxidoreductase subunit NuoK [Cycloclasticus sp.]
MGGLQIPLEHVLVLSALLFCCGLLGLMLRRNIIFMLVSLEVMLNASALAFIAAAAKWGQADGQVIFLLILTIAAAEVSVGLGLVLQIQRRFKTLDMDAATALKER